MLASAPTRLLKAAALLSAAVALVLGAAPATAAPNPTPQPLTRQQLVDRIDKASDQLEVVVERYNQLHDDLQTTVAQIGVLRRQLGPLEKQVAAHRATVGVIATAAYTSGGANAYNMLLHSSSTEDVLDQLMVIQLLADDQRSQISSLQRVRQEFQDAQATLSTLVSQGREQQKQLITSRSRIQSDLNRLQQWKDTAYGPAGHAPHTDARQGWVRPEVTGGAAKILDFALDQLGKTYKWAAEGPNAYDCSGLVLAAYKLLGKELPHNSITQYKQVRKISEAQAQPGDLVFFYKDLHHVGIYIGDGRMIHAPTFGEKVRVDMVDSLPVHGFGRVL
ncbi:C40 family peptidase [Hamadaea tsunoensis]|uniref:C40 family peptidase n=1 Tax=Hamadaea tsunoensis TaxID=53368 RepID=UPI000685EC92|nr:C40 family peptidase [Hamadaea tsunoensis]